MDLVSLKATPRVPVKGVTHRLRREGFVPVVLYGHGLESRPLRVQMADLERVLKTGAGRNNLIRLEIEGETGSEPPTVIIRDLQTDPVRGRYIHADLMRVSLRDKIRAHVRLVMHGEEAVTREGGIVQHQLREIEVECLPTNLLEHITVDLTGKGIGDAITLGDLKPPEGVKFLGEPDAVVASIVAPRAAAEEEPAEAAEGKEGEAAEGEQAEPAGK